MHAVPHLALGGHCAHNGALHLCLSTAAPSLCLCLLDHPSMRGCVRIPMTHKSWSSGYLWNHPFGFTYGSRRLVKAVPGRPNAAGSAPTSRFHDQPNIGARAHKVSLLVCDDSLAFHPALTCRKPTRWWRLTSMCTTKIASVAEIERWTATPTAALGPACRWLEG